MTTIELTSFDTTVYQMPFHLRAMIKDLKSLRERPDYHPEENTYEHIRIIFNRALQIPIEKKRNLYLACAIFHDLGKKITAKPNEKLTEKFGFTPPTSPGHDKFGAELAILHKDFIKEYFGVEAEDVAYICGQHMRISSFSQMKNSKKAIYFKDALFYELCVFHYLDDMLADFDVNNIDTYYKDAKNLIDNANTRK